MKKGSIAVASLLAINTSAAEKYSLCIFGPDSGGNFHEEIVPQDTAERCDNFCVCHDLETTCLLGPDSMCNFATAKVTRQFADDCERDFCTCSNHGDYMEVANQRLNLTSQSCLRDFLSNGQEPSSQTTVVVVEKGETSEPPEDTVPKRPTEDTVPPPSGEQQEGADDVPVNLDDSTVTVTFNGHQLTSTLDKINCRFGPDANTGEYVTAEITLQSYELICKNTEAGFCDCDFDDSLQDTQVQLIEQVLLELLEAQQKQILAQQSGNATNEVTKEVIVEKVVQGDPTIIEKDNSTDPFLLVLIGVCMTLFVVAVALCVAYAVLKKRRTREQVVTMMPENGTMAINQSDRRSFPDNSYPLNIIQQDIGDNHHGHAEGIPVHIQGEPLESGQGLGHENTNFQELRDNQKYSTLTRTTKMSDLTSDYVMSSSITSKKQKFGVIGAAASAKNAENLETVGHSHQMYGQSTFIRSLTRNGQTPGSHATPGVVSSGKRTYLGNDSGADQIQLEPHSATAFQSRESRSAGGQGFRSRLSHGNYTQTPMPDPQNQNARQNLDDVEEL